MQPLQVKAWESLTGQLTSIGMAEMLNSDYTTSEASTSAENSSAENPDEDGEEGGDPSSSTGGTRESVQVPDSKDSHRAKLQQQKHELEQEEEKLIAAQMALKRLR